jgi:phospholipase C
MSGSGTVTSSPAGIACPGTCTANFASGTMVALSATPASGFQFAGFSGACTGQSCKLTVSGDQTVSATFAAAAQVSVTVSGNGTVTSTPVGINCPGTCTASFANGTAITLTATPGSGASFNGFSGACTGTTCQLKAAAGQTQNVSASFTGQSQGLGAINHIIVMLQENRSFDEYFGHLPDYWRANNFPQATNGTTFDGEPSNASNADDSGFTLGAYKIGTACTENPSPSWDEDHTDRNRFNPTNSNTATMDGFVHTAGKDATGFGFYDELGHRAMGYFDGSQLNYYYFMASSFATSDRWFSPVMTRTQPNRMYLYAGTSAGHVYPLNSSTGQLTNQTIIQLLQDKGISWKIYAHPDPSGCATPQCLYAQSYINQFTYGQYLINHMPNQFQPISQLLTDMQNGTLPQVAFIEPASAEALDEHSSDDDVNNPPNVQSGANYVAGIINTLMNSPSWKDSVFILSYDEFGGFYDHVPPQPAVPPDAIHFPIDLQTKSTGSDICYGNTTDLVCGFYFTGFRVPLIVISPFTKKNYVSHTVADYTAILKLIETRFGLPSLTARDAIQPDMTEFFDFATVPWKTPPSPPAQARNLPCILETLGPHITATGTLPPISFSPNPAPAGGQLTVTLNLAKNPIQPTTVYLSSNPQVPSLPATASIPTTNYFTTFNITVPNGITSLTITGTIGGIPVSATVPVQ